MNATETLRRFEAFQGLSGLGTSDLTTVSSSVGAGLLKLAPVTGPAAPFIAAAGGVAEIVGAVASLFSGCGDTCTMATALVDQVGPYLQQNLTLYLGNPNRTVCDQANAIATFQQIWQTLQAKCGNPSLGAAGQRCITDRMAGSCKWRDESGACWNWFIGFYDPIVKDIPPGGSGLCVPGAASGSSSTSTATDYTPYLIAAGALLVAVVVLS